MRSNAPGREKARARSFQFTILPSFTCKALGDRLLVYVPAPDFCIGFGGTAAGESPMLGVGWYQVLGRGRLVEHLGGFSSTCRRCSRDLGEHLGNIITRGLAWPGV